MCILVHISQEFQRLFQTQAPGFSEGPHIYPSQTQVGPKHLSGWNWWVEYFIWLLTSTQVQGDPTFSICNYLHQCSASGGRSRVAHRTRPGRGSEVVGGAKYHCSWWHQSPTWRKTNLFASLKIDSDTLSATILPRNFCMPGMRSSSQHQKQCPRSSRKGSHFLSL